MAFEGQQPVKLIGAVTGADLSSTTAVQYCASKFTNTTSSGQSVCGATTDVPSGVFQSYAPTSATGQPIEVTVVGQTKMQTDGTVQVGQLIGTNASGQATPALSGMYVMGRCVANAVNEPATAGSLITVIINCANPPLKA